MKTFRALIILLVANFLFQIIRVNPVEAQLWTVFRPTRALQDMKIDLYGETGTDTAYPGAGHERRL